MNALREREINNNLERRLSEEQKLRGELKFIDAFCIYFDCHITLKLIASRRQSIELLIFQWNLLQKKNRSIENFHKSDFVCMLLAFLRNMRWSLVLTEDDKKFEEHTKNNTIFYLPLLYSFISEALQSRSQISIQTAETDRRRIWETQSIRRDIENLGDDR